MRFQAYNALFLYNSRISVSRLVLQQHSYHSEFSLISHGFEVVSNMLLPVVTVPAETGMQPMWMQV